MTVSCKLEKCGLGRNTDRWLYNWLKNCKEITVNAVNAECQEVASGFSQRFFWIQCCLTFVMSWMQDQGASSVSLQITQNWEELQALWGRL